MDIQETIVSSFFVNQKRKDLLPLFIEQLNFEMNEVEWPNDRIYGECLQISITLDSMQHSNLIIQNLITTKEGMEPFEDIECINKNVDIVFISKAFKKILNKHIIDIMLRFNKPIEWDSIKYKIYLIEQQVRAILKEQELQGEKNHHVNYSFTPYQDITNDINTQLGYCRSSFLSMCFSLVPFPEQILTCFINKRNDKMVKTLNVKRQRVKLITNQDVQMKGKQLYSQVSTSSDQNFAEYVNMQCEEKIDDMYREYVSFQFVSSGDQEEENENTMNDNSFEDEWNRQIHDLSQSHNASNTRRGPVTIKKSKKFRGSEHIWAELKICFQSQAWDNVANIMFNEKDLIEQSVSKTNINLLQQFPADYQQMGFVDLNLRLEEIREPSPQYQKEYLEITQHTQQLFCSWKRNKNIQNLVRCLLYMAVHELRKKELFEYNILRDLNFEYILKKMQDVYTVELIEHNSLKYGENVHPHPLVSFRDKLTETFTLQIDEPFTLGLLYSIPALLAYSKISHQLCVQDKKRTCDFGSIILCGETRTGKSAILDAVSQFFGGYDWLKTNANFQSPSLMNKSVCCIEEMDIEQLRNEKTGSNMWKKRLDQTISCDFDVKGRQGFSGSRHVPFIITTNKKPSFIYSNSEAAFHTRIDTIYFSSSLTPLMTFMTTQTKEQVPWYFRNLQQEDSSIKQMSANLLLIMHIFFPIKEEMRRFYYIDDIITEHIIKVFIYNQHSFLFTILFDKKQRTHLENIMTFYQSNTDFQSESTRKKVFQTSGLINTQLNQNDSYVKLNLFITKKLNISADEMFESIKNGQQAMLLTEKVGKFVCEKKHPWFTDKEDLLTKLKTELKDTNQLRHIIRVWDRVIQRLGFD